LGDAGWQICLREEDEGKAFEVEEGQRIFKAPKGKEERGDLLVRQVELLYPDPLYFKCLDFEAQGAKDVG
jgi:hypothetical protein